MYKTKSNANFDMHKWIYRTRVWIPLFFSLDWMRELRLIYISLLIPSVIYSQIIYKSATLLFIICAVVFVISFLRQFKLYWIIVKNRRIDCSAYIHLCIGIVCLQLQKQKLFATFSVFSSRFSGCKGRWNLLSSPQFH